MGIPIDPTWLEVLLLATVRMTAFLIVAPPFAHQAFPARIKAMLGLGLGLAVSQRVSRRLRRPGHRPGSSARVVLELVTGLALGFLVCVIFAAIQSAGSLIDLFSGFQMAQAFDPQMMVNGAQFTRLLQMAAIALLFASDGYQLVIGGLTGSFAALPLAGGIDLGQPVRGDDDGGHRHVPRRRADRRTAAGGAVPRRRRARPADPRGAGAERVLAGLPAEDPADADAGRLHVPGPAADRLQPRPARPRRPCWGWADGGFAGKNTRKPPTNG